jgi:CarD family transcriptional regulator
MYQCGDRVLYGIHGVCEILDIVLRTVDRKQVEYYELEPLAQPGARYYIPTQNQAAVAKLKKVIDKQTLTDLLKSDDVRRDVWIEDEGRRKQYYRELINSGDRAALLNMVHALHQHKKAQVEAGKKFHLCDDNFLRDAERLLSAEFSLALGIRPDEVGDYILRTFEKE